MVKRFKTAEGKRMTVRMTDEEVLNRIAFGFLMVAGGLLIAVLVWGAIS